LSRRALPLIALGGAIGALGRYGLARAFPVAAGTFPTPTLIINVAGAFLLAGVLETLARRGDPDHWLRLLLGIGVLGAFTTFSTFATELALLWRGGDELVAVEYAVVSVVGGSVAVLLGLRAAGWRDDPVPEAGES
jgi:CrcB protein